MSAARRQVYALVGETGRRAAHAAVTGLLVLAIAAALGAAMMETVSRRIGVGVEFSFSLTKCVAVSSRFRC